MKMITVPADLYWAIARRALFPFKNTGVDNLDGTFTFPVDEDIAERLAKISPDPEIAIRVLLGSTEKPS